MSEEYKYRPKFMDMRIKPPADEKSKAAAEQNRVCEHDSCDLEGKFPAPMRFGDGKHYFCQRHAAEYNRSFNFFDTMTDDQLKAFHENARYGFKSTWKMGTGPMGKNKAANKVDPRTFKGGDFFDGKASAKEIRRAQRSATGVAKKALGELDLGADAKSPEIRARYAEYVRRFHPDSNGGDRSSEDKLARVIRAGKTLKAAGLMKD
jgi:hypothetical protein